MTDRSRILARSLLSLTLEVGRLAEKLGETFDEGGKIDIETLSRIANPKPQG